MQIVCENCNKRFNLDQNLIPKEGRYLQCSACNHKWFYKNIVIEKKIIEHDYKEPKKKIEIKEVKIDKKKDLKANKLKKDNKKDKKKINLFNLMIVFVISLIALIIFLDTFKYNLKSIFPSIDYLLENLYESIKDIILFVKDLIK